jgi:hypothetical protein
MLMYRYKPNVTVKIEMTFFGLRMIS